MADLRSWGPVFEKYLRENGPGDPAHYLDHVKRVVWWSTHLTLAEGARAEVTFPAAWLHDCVAVAKDSPDRNRASGLAAQKAVAFLRAAGYALADLAEIAHAIEAHSFSARVAPQTIEACVVQDADRLDAIGAVGIARCLMTGGSLSRPLSSAVDPFCRSRTPDERTATIDHFYAKLLGLGESMKTMAGRSEACSRIDFMVQYLSRLESELVLPDDPSDCAGERHHPLTPFPVEECV